jgi:hypothetical protein
MRNQKVAADPVTGAGNPANKLRRSSPQIQSPVAAKKPDTQFAATNGVNALRKMFKESRNQPVKRK